MQPRTPLPPSLRNRAFTTAEATALGVGRGRLEGRDLRSPVRGVWVSRDVPLTLEALCRAVLSVRPSAFACGTTAAALWGAPLPQWCATAPLELAVPGGRAPSGRGISGRELKVGPQSLRVRAGIPLTSPSRTWTDLGTRLGLLDLVAVGDYLIHHRRHLATIDDFTDATRERAGDRGVVRLREAIPLLSDRSESRRESRLRVMLVRAGIRGIEANYWVVTITGHRHRIDLAIPEKKVAIEYQGDHHFDPEQQMADMTRRSRLQASGWIVIEVSKADLADVRDLVTRIRATVASR